MKTIPEIVNFFNDEKIFITSEDQPAFTYADLKRQIDWTRIDLFSGVGYFVECDLYYQEEIHNPTKDFPLCPENIDITYDMLSPFQKMCLQKIYDRQSYRQRKLTASFLPRNQM